MPMLEDIRNFARICQAELGKPISIAPSYKLARNIVLAGMGGSAIPGDVIRDSFALKVPLEVSRGYDVPSYVDADTLLICVSYSGNTRETLSQLEQGIRSNCKICGVTSDGELEDKLEELGLPIATVPRQMLPRAALPYLLSAVTNILSSLGFIAEKITIQMEPYQGEVENRAKELAGQLKSTFPIICSAYSSVGKRFKAQLDENAKMLCKYEVLPELNHNEIESWVNLTPNFPLVFFRDREERQEIEASVRAIKEIVGSRTNCLEVFAEGKTRWERILYLIWVGDFASYFLAEENRVDPETTDLIKRLKRAIG